MTERFAQVALPLPLPDPYTYRIPASLADRALPGARVVVPVRRQEWIGIVTAVDVRGAIDDGARPARPRPTPVRRCPPSLLALAQQMARYYGAPTRPGAAGHASRRAVGAFDADAACVR